LRVASRLCWVTQTVVRILSITAAFFAAGEEARRTGTVVHKLLLLPSPEEDTSTEFQLFSTQLLSNKVEFSAGGFVPVNLSLAYSMLGAAATYIIILFQFKVISRSFQQYLQAHVLFRLCHPSTHLKYVSRVIVLEIDTTARYRRSSKLCTVLSSRVLQLKIYVLLFYTFQAKQKKNGRSFRLEKKKEIGRPRRIWRENFKNGVGERVC
jgi:hypothetical protein